jgi:hypothetical protein
MEHGSCPCRAYLQHLLAIVRVPPGAIFWLELTSLWVAGMHLKRHRTRRIVGTLVSVVPCFAGGSSIVSVSYTCGGAIVNADYDLYEGLRGGR